MKVKHVLAVLAVVAAAAATVVGSASAAVASQTVCNDGVTQTLAPGGAAFSQQLAENAALAGSGAYYEHKGTLAGFAYDVFSTDSTNWTTPPIWFDSVTPHQVSKGACPANATPPPPPVGIFLCYSQYQSTPGVWPKDVAIQLLQQGYWLPYAVKGNEAGGTNVGDYHLSCSAVATQSLTSSYVGGDGTVLGSAYAGDPGIYPLANG